MRKILKGIALTLSVLTAFTTAASAKTLRIDTRGMSSRDLSSPNDIFCDDFRQGGNISSYGWSASAAGDSTIGIAQTTDENGKKQNALLISDKVPGDVNSGGVIKKGIGEINSGTVSLEIKFKMEVPDNKETTFASNGLYLITPDNKWATRFYVLGDASGGSILWNGTRNGTFQKKITPGAWYTFSMDADLDSKEVTAVLKSSALEDGFVYHQGLGFQSGLDKITVNSVMFESRMFTADWYIDYIRMTRNSPIVEKPKPTKPTTIIPAPISAAPVMRAVPNSVNVMRNGAYTYFSQKPVLNGENVMVTAISAFRVFGLNTTIADGKYTASDGINKVIAALDGSKLTVNGKDVPIGSITLSDGDVLVSLNEIAKALGETAEWNQAENTLYINGKEAAE